MNTEYLDKLVSDTRQLVLLIETHIETQIIVREVPTREHLGCEIENATILTPENRFPDSSVLHELLHIRRFRVDDVPRLAVCNAFDFADPTFATRVTDLDNNLEHLFIVPEELSLRPNRRTYWEDRVRNAIKNQRNSGLDVNVHGCDAVVNWVFANHVLGGGCAVDEATEVARELNCEETSKRLLSTLQQPNCSKGAFSRACLAELDLPGGSICLRYSGRGDREEVM